MSLSPPFIPGKPAPSAVSRAIINENPFKMVATDLDGTLLNSQHMVKNKTRYVLSQLLARGVHVIFATGRPFTDVCRIKRKLNIFAQKKDIPVTGVHVLTPVTPAPSQHVPSEDDIIHSPNSVPVIPRCFAITNNGASIYDEANRKVYEECIHPLTCKKLYPLFKDDPQININVFRGVNSADRSKADYYNASDISDREEDRAVEEWVCRYPAEIEAALYAATKFTYRVVENIETTFSTEDVNNVFFLCYDPAKAREAEKTIRKVVQCAIAELPEDFPLTSYESVSGEGILRKISVDVRVAPSAPHCLDVIPANASKASALQHILEQLNLDFSDVVSFGDGLNDLEMLSSVGKGFVMENANERVKHILIEKDEDKILRDEGEYALNICKKAQGCELIGRNDDEAVAVKLAELFNIDLSHIPEEDWETMSVGSA